MKFKQPFKVLGAAGAAGIIGAMAFAGPALADDHSTTIYLKSAHQNQAAVSDEFPEICSTHAQIPEDKSIDEDGWVFVLPSKSGDEFVSVTATFEDGDGVQTTLEAEIVTAGNSGSAKHAYVATPGGWILIDAEAEVIGSDSDTDTFNVTHTCPAGDLPTDEETPTDGVTSPSEEESSPGEEETSPGMEESSPGEESTSPAGETLPTTGAPLTVALVSAGALAAGGAALFFMMRRRRAAENW